MLNHAHPTGFGFALVVSGVFAILEVFIQGFEIDFLVATFWGVHHRASIAVHKPAFTLGGRTIAQHAVHGIVSQRLASVIGHIKTHVDGVIVFVEGKYLVHFHAIHFWRSQTHFNFVCIAQIVLLLGGREFGAFRQ